MAGTANSGRRRTPIPTGKEAEEELRRLRRNERRAARRAGKRGDAPEELTIDTLVPPPPPATGSLAPPSPEELKADLMFAFNELGGRAGLVAWGRRYPKEFYQLWSKFCLPKEDSDNLPDTGLEALLAQLDTRKETMQ